jgi:hypothetical protein
MTEGARSECSKTTKRQGRAGWRLCESRRYVKWTEGVSALRTAQEGAAPSSGSQPYRRTLWWAASALLGPGPRTASSGRTGARLGQPSSRLIAP